MMYQKEYQLWVESVKEECLKEQLEKMTGAENNLEPMSRTFKKNMN